jgi:hypothetical protein
MYKTPLLLEVLEVVELLDRYINKDWKEFEKALEEQYWQNGRQKNTPSDWNQLVNDGLSFDLSVNVLKHSFITQALVTKNGMSVMQHCWRFLDSLSGTLREKPFEF